MWHLSSGGWAGARAHCDGPSHPKLRNKPPEHVTVIYSAHGSKVCTASSGDSLSPLPAPQPSIGFQLGRGAVSRGRGRLDICPHVCSGCSSAGTSGLLDDRVRPASVSCSCCDKMPRTGGLKATEMNSEFCTAKVRHWSAKGAVLSHLGEIPSLPCPASDGSCSPWLVAASPQSRLWSPYPFSPM